MKRGKKRGRGSNGDYQVGYGKPPVASRFQKGRSGNPKGRPKRAAGVDESLAEKFDEEIVVERDGRREAVTKRELSIIRLIERALKGNIGALRKVFHLIREIEPAAAREPFKIVYAPNPPGYATWRADAAEAQREADAKKASGSS